MTKDVNELANRTILIVEDEALVAMMIVQMIEELGCEAEGPVATIEAALSAIGSTRADAAIVDVNLLGHDSAPVVAALQARGIPLVIATGSDTNRHTGIPQVSKPFFVEELRAALIKAFKTA